MKRLLKAEFFKLLKSMLFWLLLALSITDGIIYSAAPELYGSSFTGYNMYIMRLASGMFNAVLICALAVSFVCDEFTYGTFRLTLFEGFTRRQAFMAKAAVFAVGIFPMVLLHVAVSTALVTAVNGFGYDNVMLSDLTLRLICYLAECCFLGSCGIFAAVIARNRVGTFGIGIGMAYIFLMGSACISDVPMVVRSGAFMTGAVLVSVMAVYIFERCDLE